MDIMYTTLCLYNRCAHDNAKKKTKQKQAKGRKNDRKIIDTNKMNAR